MAKQKKEAKAKAPRTAHPLVGKFFHSHPPDDHKLVKWQGQVLGVVAPGKFLVQLFEWISGCENDQIIVSLADMRHWSFYDTADAMRDRWETWLRPYNELVTRAEFQERQEKLLEKLRSDPHESGTSH